MKRAIGVSLFILAGFVPQAQGANYYFSASGNDSSDGSINTPWKTLAKASSLIPQPADKLLFKRGDTFVGQLVIKGSGTAVSPIEIGSYGTGELPILTGSGDIPTGDYHETVRIINKSHILMTDLWIKNDRQNKGTSKGWGTNRSTGIYVHANNTVSKGLTFRNLKITDVFGIDMMDWEGKFTLKYYSAHGIWIDSEKNNLAVTPIKEVGIEDVLIEGCYFYKIGSQGVATRHLSNIRNHPIDDEDRNKNFVIRNCTFQQLGGDGAVLSGLYNGLVEKNDFIDLGWGDSNSSTDRYYGRGEGCWTWNARNIIVQFNRQYRAKGFGDCYGSGHIDFFCHNNIFQYNYSEDTDGGFIEVLGDCKNSTFRFNVSVNDGRRANGHHRFSIWLSGYVGSGEEAVPSDNTYIYNNTIYLDDAAVKPGISLFAKNTYIFNNIFYAINGASIGTGSGELGVNIDIASGSELLISDNLFYGDIANAFIHRDSNPITGHDPQFVDPTATDSLGRRMDGFKLQSTSPAIDAGRKFPEPEFPMAGQEIFAHISLHAPTDYYGNPVDVVNLTANIGADNSWNRHIGDPNTFAHFIAKTEWGIDPDQQGFDDDPDGDRIKNGLEAWFGTHPGQPNKLFSELADNNEITFSHPQSKYPPSDVSVFYEWSPNLSGWYAGDGLEGPVDGPTVVIVPVTTGTTTTATSTASEAVKRIFLRVRTRQN